mmetsp:Transcript_18056/g.34243  ORF Transcript_18056/g.34243 Transcript_18056/m.34243 type:complete len:212 (-) Transcript_18056:222-857(-)
MCKSVSFEEKDSHNSTVQRPPSKKMSSILRRGQVPKPSVGHKVLEIKRAWRCIMREKLADPLKLVQGEVVSFWKGGKEGVSWMFSWDYLANCLIAQDGQSRCRVATTEDLKQGFRGGIEVRKLRILKRGHLVSELLRRGQRNVSQERYLNPFLQRIYRNLVPALRKKTDFEWFARRRDQKKSILSPRNPCLVIKFLKHHIIGNTEYIRSGK